MPKKPPEWLSTEIQAFYALCQGNIRAIQGAIREKHGVEIAYMTISNRMDQLGLERPRKKSKLETQGEPMTDETPVEVLPGQTDLDADTAPAEVHYGAVHEFEALPEGYAKVIQPMRPYSDAEEWALNKSMELYGFIGSIVYDQYGRVLDGHHRQRVARLHGLGVPHTITPVMGDAHAVEIARSLNAVRRQYTPEERQTLALQMRDHGYTYRAIADALGVGKSTVYRDVFGELRIRPESEIEPEIVPNGTIEPSLTETPVSDETPQPVSDNSHVPHGTIPTMEPPTPAQPPEPVKRVQRKGGGTYPAQRPTTQKASKPSSIDQGTTATQWHNRLVQELTHIERVIGQFQAAGGMSVLGREFSPGMRDSLLGDLRGKAKMLREMADYLEVITQEPTATSQMFEPQATSQTSEA